MSRGIFHERRSAIVAVDWNERALRRAHPNRENSHARISRGLGCLRRITVQLFAIGENDQRSISGGAFSKCVYGEIDRFGNIRPAFGNRLCVQIVNRFDGRFVIDCQRCLQKGATGTRDQSNAVALHLINEILRREFDAFEAIWLHVVRKHAP